MNKNTNTIYTKYNRFIRENFRIVDKEGNLVIFEPNAIQAKFSEEASGKDIILKARQQGFSSYILAVFNTDFILKPNCLSVVVADNADNAQDLLLRVKNYIKEYEDINKVKVPLKYNSKYELYNSATDARYIIGTAQNVQFGRSKTIHNLHMSEAAFYPQFRMMLASALQAVAPTGRVVIETTANGYNELKTFWDESVLGETGFKPLFYPAQDFYDDEFLKQKKQELGKRLYDQEYPSSAELAFIVSGESFFDNESLQYYLTQVKEPIKI